MSESAPSESVGTDHDTLMASQSTSSSISQPAASNSGQFATTSSRGRNGRGLPTGGATSGLGDGRHQPRPKRRRTLNREPLNTIDEEQRAAADEMRELDDLLAAGQHEHDAQDDVVTTPHRRVIHAQEAASALNDGDNDSEATQPAFAPTGADIDDMARQEYENEIANGLEHMLHNLEDQDVWHLPDRPEFLNIIQKFQNDLSKGDDIVLSTTLRILLGKRKLCAGRRPRSSTYDSSTPLSKPTLNSKNASEHQRFYSDRKLRESTRQRRTNRVTTRR